MKPNDARDYLVTLTTTATGRSILAELGYAAVIDAPRRGDNQSSVIVARHALEEFLRRYPMLFGIDDPEE